ncbi:Rv3235 family protein [Timonella senegalensis]|uniref:Rv3235 family protein n=1 Tax=Timonella senegalensis TaxID=1465825 RepID=UPI002FDE0810
MTAVLETPALLNCLPGDPNLRLANDPSEARERIARATQLADPTAVMCATAHAAIEALHGHRPVQQLAGILSPDVFQSFHSQVRAQTSLDLANGKRRTSTPARATQRAAVSAQQPGTRTPALRRVPTRIVRARVVRVSAVAAEGTVLLQDGNRVRAAALRAEEFRGRWRICVLQIL